MLFRSASRNRGLPPPHPKGLSMAFLRRIFSGIRPTGNLHLGNYLGAVRNWVALQNEFECIFCMVDMHAITASLLDPDDLRRSTRELAAAMIASGIDPRKNILFNQSQNPDHATLAWIFNCIARMGWMNRMTQFKEKAGKDRENEIGRASCRERVCQYV